MRRFFRIYRQFVRSSLQRELEFRANFIAKIFQNTTWIIFFILILLVTFDHTDTVAGWTKYESALLAGTCFLVDAMIRTFAFSLMDLPQHVRMGTLDFVVTKPVDSQIYVSLRRVNFDQIGPILASLLFFIYGASNLTRAVTFVDWLAFAVLAVCSTLIYFSMMSIFMTLSIWFVKVDNLWVLGETTFQVSRYPFDIFPLQLRQFITFGVPLAFIATVPASALRSGADLTMLALGVVYAAVGLLAARLFWRYSVRHYTSASS